MFIYGLPNANASVIAVTDTATGIFDLINTAGSTSAVFPSGLTGVDLHAEDGDIRYLMDGNTPTASKGVLLKQGERAHLRNKDVSKLKLIRTGSSNVAVSVTIGFASNDESDTFSNTQIAVSTLNALVSGVETNNIGVVPFRRSDSFQDLSFDGTHSTSATSVKSATASKKHYLTNLTISSSVAATITIDDADGNVLEKVIFPAAGIFRATYTDVPLVTAAVNKAIRVTSSVSSGTLTVKGRGYTI